MKCPFEKDISGCRIWKLPLRGLIPSLAGEMSDCTISDGPSRLVNSPRPTVSSFSCRGDAQLAMLPLNERACSWAEIMRDLIISAVKRRPPLIGQYWSTMEWTQAATIWHPRFPLVSSVVIWGVSFTATDEWKCMSPAWFQHMQGWLQK